MYSTETSMESSWINSSQDGRAPLDPWDTNESDQQNDTDNWLLGYVDILTLMLTLMVLLLAFNQIENKRSESIRIKNPLEILQSPPKASPPKASPPKASPPKASPPKASPLKVEHAQPSPGTRSTPTDLALKQNVRVHLSMPPAYKRTAYPITETAYPIKINEFRDLPDQNFRGQLHDNTLDSLDLSIDPVGPLGHPLPSQNTVPTITVSAPSLQRRARKQSKPDISPRNNVEIFQRVISEQNLEGLIDVSQSRNAVRMEVNESILFETGNADLKPGGKRLLDQLAIILRSHLGSIHVEGHTDNIPISTPRYPSNWELSASRASTVARNLIDRQISSDRLRAIGFADTKPRNSNKTAQDRSKNRRVSLVIEFDHSNS